MNILKARFEQAYGPAILSGLLLFLSFPKIDFYPFAWIALVPLLLFLYDKDKRTAFKAGFFTGIVYFFGTTYWIYHSINKYGSIPLAPSLFLVFLLCVYLSLYPALFAYLYSANIKRTTMPSMFVAPILWTTLEFIRSYALSGFPWSSLGYSQYKLLPVIQIADITGVYGISFLIVAVNGALADIFLLNRRHTERPLSSFLPTISGFVILFCLIVATLSYGIYRLHEQRGGHYIKVAVVQGNIEQDKKWDPSYQQAVINTYKDLSFAAAKESPDLIVWPETAAPFFFSADKKLSFHLVSFQQQLNSYLLFGSVLVKDIDKSVKGYSNSAVLLDKNGNITYIYDKIHLVPFGEYVPFKKLLFFVDKLAYGIGDYIPGDGYTKAVTPFGSFGTLICYEITFPGLVRKFYTRGGDFIVTITNDAWFGRTHGPYQHFSMAVFRAIENRKPVVRAANTGISGFIDSNGRIMNKTELFKRTYVVDKIKTDKTLSPYTKYGDIFSYLSIISTLLLLIKKKSRF
ncbi:MAG: apolipoprotein N-acyltransferase [Nitrospirae bacterium]|nr:apolipoprotein N-acyltransferase [Nitrospirota bacterium]